MVTIAAFLLVLGLIILFHEFGHLVTAKAFGMRVFIFSFGFGKRLFGFKWGDTDIRVSLVPLGGYVKLEGEPEDYLSGDPGTEVVALGDGEMVRVDNPRYFTNRPRWQRFLVYLAGPVMNAVLTIGVMTVLFMVGFEVEGSLQEAPIVGAVEPGSPAAEAGLLPGDEIRSVDGRPTPTWEDALYAVLIRPDRAFPLRVRRAGQELEVVVRSTTLRVRNESVGSIGVTPLVRIGKVNSGSPGAAAGLQADDAILAIDGKPIRSFADIPERVRGASGRPLVLSIYRQGRVIDVSVTPRDDGEGPRIGIAQKTVVRKFGPAAAVAEATRWTWSMTRQTFEVLGRLLTGRLSPKTIMGPIGIARTSGDAARGGGAIGLFHVVAVISLQVGLFNLVVPLPILDAGQMYILLLEAIRRRDLAQRTKELLMQAGLVAVILLVCLVVYSDLSKTGWFSKYLP